MKNLHKIVWKNISDGKLDKYLNSSNSLRDNEKVSEPKKETEGKLTFEIDWDFVKSVAERMQSNKGKYEPFNWKKPMNVKLLLDALMRHVLEVMKENYKDEDREYGHLEAIACNVMMILYQLKNNKKQI